MKIQFTLLFIIVAALFVLAFYLETTPTGMVVEPGTFVLEIAEQDIKEEIIDMTPDFIDKNLGTMVLWTNVNLMDRKDGLVEFFSSKKIKGLSIRYRLGDNRLIGGLPVLVSGSENNLDGGRHMIAYSFKKGEGQALVFDGQIVAQGEYTGIEEKMPVGMVVSYPSEHLEPESAQTYQRILDLHEIKEMFESET